MNVLYVYKDYFPVLGGIENHVKYLAEGLAAESAKEVRQPLGERVRGQRLIPERHHEAGQQQLPERPVERGDRRGNPELDLPPEQRKVRMVHQGERRLQTVASAE